MVNRRLVFLGGAAAVGLAALAFPRRPAATPPPASGAFPLTLTDAQWKSRLSLRQYAVLRQAGTEIPFTSPLLDEHRSGLFGCAGCGQDLFSSKTKFDSGTGWPSFWAPLPKAVGERLDTSWLEARTEVHCSRCGGHLGHVFNDGPPPTGLRYRMNGQAMTFRPAAV
jgi:peptide-methionine (R)-S-oxide reductase